MKIYNKKKLGLSMVIFVAQSLHAQIEIGVESGLNKNCLITSDAQQYFTKYNSAIGLRFGVPLLYHFTDWFALQTDINFTQKNYKISRTGFFQGVFQKSSNNYVEFPVFLNFSFGGEKIRAFFNPGIYVAYWVSGRIKGRDPNILDPSDTTTTNPMGIFNEDNEYAYNQKYHFSNNDNRIELGWIGGVGIEYQLNHIYHLFLETRYIYSLTDQQKKYEINQVPKYNTTSSIVLGCLLRLEQTKHKKG